MHNAPGLCGGLGPGIVRSEGLWNETARQLEGPEGDLL